MNYEYLMNIATVLYIACYIPELYANWKNRNANIYNFPEKIVILIGSGFAFSYAVLNNDMSLIINYGPILTLDLMAFLMRGYYVYKTHIRVADSATDSVLISNSNRDDQTPS